MNGHFRYTTYTFDAAAGTASFHYELTRKDGQVLAFSEHLTIPPLPVSASHDQQTMLTKVLELLHIGIGTSYWKIDCPLDINHPYVLSKQESDFWNVIYTEGLGEFYYTNQLDPATYALFVSGNEEEKHRAVSRPNGKKRALTGIGGGKDSLVSIDVLKKAGYAQSLFTMENDLQTATLDEVIAVTGEESVRVQRRIDNQLRTITDGYKGHVPISLIYALVGVLVAVLHDYSSVIVSNEESSNYGNVEYKGYTINHQWSKSEVFEAMFQKLIHSVVSPDITYFSLMRPFTELKIAQLFSRLEQYHRVFSSCNRNFRITDGESRGNLTWCGECAKCCFTFALLSGFIAKEKLVSIFGKNMFADETLLSEYRKLLGTESIKPFDCVGTPDEVAAAFYMAHKTGSYEQDHAMQYFVMEVVQKHPGIEHSIQTLLEYKSDSLIPEPFTTFLKTYED